LCLAAQYLERGREYDAERLLAKGRSETDDDPRIRHLWEDTRLSRLETKIGLARKKAEVQNSSDVQAELETLTREREQLEMEIFAHRSDTDPDNGRLHYELGLRVKRSGNFRTACHHLKKALIDPTQKCAAAYELGECLRLLNEPREALRYYRIAADSPADAELLTNKTRALLHAGEIASQFKLARLARHCLNAVLRIDPRNAEAAALLKRFPESAGSAS
jgi:tetratricopeptide (TPR) repeat protein